MPLPPVRQLQSVLLLDPLERVYGDAEAAGCRRTVGAGNLNRCLYLKSDDVGRDKAVALAERAAADFPGLRLVPEVAEFRRCAEVVGRVDTAIVTVDSRRARRGIQEYAPRRVFDASTTDVTAVVVHSHAQPTDGACLACIYRHIPDEHARERSIADGLGIDLRMAPSSSSDGRACTPLHWPTTPDHLSSPLRPWD